MFEARLWKSLKNESVQCRLCNHFCAIKPGERGRCGVRQNIDGTLYALNYGKSRLSISTRWRRSRCIISAGTRTYRWLPWDAI